MKARLESAASSAIEISHEIHSHPEVGFEEVFASSLLASKLKAAGLEVEMGAGDIPTAFVGKTGIGDLTVGIFAEYDALPGIGHACGHNVIAAAAYLAATALAPFADDLGITLQVLGTPAEEGGGGKILMLERGCFTGLNLALMVHPGPNDIDRMDTVAAKHLEITYEGRAAHAAGFPFLGINAQDAMTVAQVAIALARQQLMPYDKVHGIVTHGGDAPNIIPALVEATYIIRSETLVKLAELEPKIMRCFEAGAVATGSKLLVHSPSPTYSEFIHDEQIVDLYVSNATEIGRTFVSSGGLRASTDMANISLEVPSIHPMVSIDSLPAVNHQPEFTSAAASPAADRAVVDSALAMAWTIIDAAQSLPIRSRLLSHSCR